MTISFVAWTDNYGYPETTLAVTPAAVGNIQILNIHIDTTFASASSVTGGGVGEWVFIDAVNGAGTNSRLEMWVGTVQAAGSSTVTVAFTSGLGASTYTSLIVGEFSSSYGGSTSWAVDGTPGNVNTSVTSTSFVYPSLNAAGSGELYYGYVMCGGGSVPQFTSLTSGYNYGQNGDDMATYDTSVSGSGNQPACTMSPAGSYAGLAALFTASATTSEIDYALTMDSASSTSPFTRTGRDTAANNDSAAVGRVFHRTSGDTSDTTDAVATSSEGQTGSDTSHTSDSATRFLATGRTASDFSLTVDIASGQFTRAASDTSHTTDTASGAGVKYYVGFDTSLTSDNATSTVFIVTPAPLWPTVAPGPTLHGLSAEFLASVVTNHIYARKVEVWNGGVFLQDITQYVTAGSVSVDETAEIRRTCTLTIAGVPEMIPEKAGDLLHPASANELYIYRGVQYSDGTTEYAQLGVFRMTKPIITDDDTTPSIAISGQDRASVIARNSWLVPYDIPAGNNIAVAIQEAMESRYSGLTYNFQNIMVTSYDEIAGQSINTPFTYPATTFGADQVAGSGETSDPMSDLITFAATAGCELFFDAVGVATLRQIINPLTETIVDSVHFVEGQNCTMTSISRTFDESTAYNGVQLYCNGTGNALPFVVTVWDTDPGSSTYYLGPWGKVPYIITTTAIPAGMQSAAQARAAAEVYAYGQLQLVLGAFDDVSLTCIPNPALREGDCVQVTRGRVKVNDSYVVSSMTIPLDPQTEMDITLRPRIQTSL